MFNAFESGPRTISPVLIALPVAAVIAYAISAGQTAPPATPPFSDYRSESRACASHHAGRPAGAVCD